MAGIEFLFPLDGDFVNSRDGKWQDGALWVEFVLRADSAPTVNGVASVREGEVYKVTVPLYGYRNAVVAEAGDTQEKIAVFVMAEENLKKYRLSSDDNIRFLKELTEGDYKSIFDHPYLAVYKKAHDLYGAKVHINLFYAFDDRARAKFNDDHGYFDLSMMTDRYKDEFIKNSDWLKLAFHARSEHPDRPYKYADRETVRRDCVAVCREICRFAGPGCISDSTTVHWGEGNREVIRELRALGFTSLTGYFTLTKSGEPSVSYYHSVDDVVHLGARDFRMDTSEDMIFGRIDRVLNVGTLEDVMKEVDFASNNPHRGGFVSIMIHEQYFYPDYSHHRPDFEQRVLQPCKLLAERGYTGAHITDVTRERPLRENPFFK